jgi:hypothetical protein
MDGISTEKTNPLLPPRAGGGGPPAPQPGRRGFHTRCAFTFAITIHATPSASMDNAYLRMSNKHNKLVLSDATLRHNWHIDKR